MNPGTVNHSQVLAAAGDVDALMQLAVWHLGGTKVPRNLVSARNLLRRAVEIGHCDAALMEIALTANGGGASADWKRALALLEIAAASDPVAKAQRALLGRMALDTDGMPAILPTGERLSEKPRVTCFPSLFTPDECRHVATVASDLLEPATVLDPGSGRKIIHPVRTADNCAIGPAREDLVIRALNSRIAAISGTIITQGEPLTVLRYASGQQYRPHVDTIAGAQNQRIRTVLVYLNQGYGGGETRFLSNGLTVTGKGGDAIMFDNVYSDGTPDPQSQHAGLPVTLGTKWMATRWIRAAPYDPWLGDV